MKKIMILFGLIIPALTVFSQKIALNVVSYNIRYQNTEDGVNSWENRKQNVKALLMFYDADVIGMQEVLAEQFDYLLTGSGYEAVGVGRDDGLRKGEFSPIYFRKDRFIKKDAGFFWLSPTPDVPSRGWDAAIKRICSWVTLYDKINKKDFIVFNTHFDHVGVQARIQSAELIKAKIQEIAPKLPVVLTGDLNVTPETSAISTIKSFLYDAKEHSIEAPYGPEGTFNAFDFNSPLKNRIDYIFVNKGFSVQKFAVLSDSKERKYYSDHLPVYSKIVFK